MEKNIKPAYTGRMENIRENKIKTWRILETDKLIREGNFPNATDIARHFEISRSTVCRDIDFLRIFYNAPIEFDQAKNGYYYTDKTFCLQKIDLTESELFTISTVYPLLKQYKNTPIEKTMRAVFDKIIAMLPDNISVDTTVLGSDISLISDPLPAIDTEVFTRILKALKARRRISFLYLSGSGNPAASNQERRSALPYHVVCHRGNWYMIAFCHKHNEIRTFSFSRISKPKIEKDYYSIPEDFNPRLYFDTAFGVWNNNRGKEKVELLFSPCLSRYIREHKWHETQVIKQKKDGSILLTFETNQVLESTAWILSFGPLVKVLNPGELVEHIKSKAESILAVYNEGKPPTQ